MQKRNLSDWAGQVALVTGASSGIGEAVAEKLASVGMQCATRDIGYILDRGHR